MLLLRDGGIVRSIFRKLREVFEIRRFEPPILAQRIRTDPQSAAGKRRKGVIGRKTYPHRSHRQHLPPAVAGLGQKIDKAKGFPPQTPRDTRPWEGSRMEKQTARSFLQGWMWNGSPLLWLDFSTGKGLQAGRKQESKESGEIRSQKDGWLSDFRSPHPPCSPALSRYFEPQFL